MSRSTARVGKERTEPQKDVRPDASLLDQVHGLSDYWPFAELQTLSTAQRNLSLLEKGLNPPCTSARPPIGPTGSGSARVFPKKSSSYSSKVDDPILRMNIHEEKDDSTLPAGSASWLIGHFIDIPAGIPESPVPIVES
jgi:hypothetical protein